MDFNKFIKFFFKENEETMKVKQARMVAWGLIMKRIKRGIKRGPVKLNSQSANCGSASEKSGNAHQEKERIVECENSFERPHEQLYSHRF